jgi:catechol 2,3-dioxygenase-like lactoylglutathione lyase family enzyme
MSHVSVGTNELRRAKAFYDAVLATLQIGVVMEHAGITVAYGRVFPEFWVHLPHDGGKAAVGNGAHFGFLPARSMR